MHESVKLASSGLRRFESYPTHQNLTFGNLSDEIGRASRGRIGRAKIGKFNLGAII